MASSPSEPLLAITLPQGWVTFDLDADAIDRMRSFVAVVQPVLDRAGIAAGDLTALFNDVAGDHRLDDVRLAAAWLHRPADGSLVQATLNLTLAPGAVLDFLDADPLWDVASGKLADGSPVLRRTRVRPYPGLVAGRAGASGVEESFGDHLGLAEYYLPAPRSAGVGLATFSSFTIGAWDKLLLLFDNIIRRSSWLVA